MAKLLSGLPVSESLCERLSAETAGLRERGVIPTMEIVRVGERPEDLRYERGAEKRARSMGVEVKKTLLPQDVSEETLIRVLERINGDDTVHGCLLFRPLPSHLNTGAVLSTLRPEKDVDAMTGAAMGGLLVQGAAGFPPCTAAACLELLRYYQIPLVGRSVVIVGTGATVGLPAVVLLLQQGATVSACNVLTPPQRLRELCRGADIILSAAGKAGLIGRDHVREGQVIVDVGVSPGPDGKLHGDVDFERVEPIVAAITPALGGVGAVTSTVLAAHAVEAALRACGPERTAQSK